MVRSWGIGLVTLAALSGSAFASSADIQKSLIGALTCQGDPMGLVHDLAETGNARSAEGFVGYEMGEEMDLISGIALTTSLKMGAASTHNVVASTMNLYEGFGAFVHAQFVGDYRPIVAELKLKRSKPDESFKRALPAQNADDICPKTIELFPQGNGRFLLGCTWCSG